MTDLFAESRWPNYDAKCKQWAIAFRRLEGEFRRDPVDELFAVGMPAIVMVFGGLLIGANLRGVESMDSPMFLIMGASLAALALYWTWRKVGIRYRLGQAAIAEVTAFGHVGWRESLTTLQTVSFPVTPGGPPMLTLHWPGRRRTIELFGSVKRAVDAALASEAKGLLDGQMASWSCPKCKEANPESFEICWTCKTERPDSPSRDTG